MKRIIMATVTEETVKMGLIEFKTEEAVLVDDETAESLLKREYPRFKEADPEDTQIEATPKADKKITK